MEAPAPGAADRLVTTFECVEHLLSYRPNGFNFAAVRLAMHSRGAKDRTSSPGRVPSEKVTLEFQLSAIEASEEG